MSCINDGGKISYDGLVQCLEQILSRAQIVEKYWCISV